MKTAIIILSTLSILNFKAQTLIGIKTDIGQSKIVTNFNNNSTTEKVVTGNAIGLAININFKTAKRFNPILNLGYINKKSTAVRELMYNDPYNVNNYIKENLTTTTSINGLKLDLGIRFNILNTKNNLFIEALLCNNFILDIQNKRNTTGLGLSTSYSTKPSTPYYLSLPLGIGYNYNNMFSIAFIYNPGLTYFESFSRSRINTYGLSLCYYLPILGNKKN